MQVRIPFPDILAATDDFDGSPIVAGIHENGYIQLDPDTITPEGLKLLAEAFARRELRMGEDRVRSRATARSDCGRAHLDMFRCCAYCVGDTGITKARAQALESAVICTRLWSTVGLIELFPAGGALAAHLHSAQSGAAFRLHGRTARGLRDGLEFLSAHDLSIRP